MYFVSESSLDWPANRNFAPSRPNIPETTLPAVLTISALDAGRSWSGLTQSIGISFSEAVTGDATGWSVSVNGVAKALTYVSGSGTQNWVMQIGALIHHDDVIRLTYSTATGNTLAVTDSAEIKGQVAVQFKDQLSKRIRFTLCAAASTPTTPVPVPNEAVKAALMEYDSGVVANTNWMVQANKGTVTTDAAGGFDMQYTGSAVVGGTVYVAWFRANGENALGTQVVV